MGGVNHYLEFGCGGSTFFALERVNRVTSIDSHPDWIENVRKAAQMNNRLRILRADIGPVKDWGYPLDDAPREKLDTYLLIANKAIKDADFIFIDGRFRVACFAHAIAQGYSQKIALHDYRSRPWFHVVEKFAEPIEEVDDLTIFMPSNRDVASHILEKYRYNPA